MTEPRLVKASSHRLMTVGEVLFVMLMLGWLTAVLIADENVPLPNSAGPATASRR